MTQASRILTCLKLLVLTMGPALFSSCSTPLQMRIGSACVRRMDFSAAPQAQVLGPRLTQAADQWYPAVCALLDDGHSQSPKQFDISVRKRLPNDNLAETRIGQICLNAAYLDFLKQEPALLEPVLVHEAAHVAQHYYRPIIGRWLVYDPGAPAYWREGIADYMCFKLGVTNAGPCAQCDSVFPHYRNGYSCAGAFLLYLEQNFDPSIVPQLNAVLRQGHYSEGFFFEKTGKALSELWAEFQKTPGFTQSAARMLQLQQELGFIEGKPPRDIAQRLDRFLDQNADARTKQLIAGARMAGVKRGDAQSRLALINYFTQPGGTAEAYIVGLEESGKLPGFAKGEQGHLRGLLNSRNLNTSMPGLRSFIVTKQGDGSTYHYTVVRSPGRLDWKLERACRTNPDGSLGEEFPTP